MESKGENLTGEAMRTDKLGGGGRWRAGNQKEWNLEWCQGLSSYAEERLAQAENL